MSHMQAHPDLLPHLLEELWRLILEDAPNYWSISRAVLPLMILLPDVYTELQRKIIAMVSVDKQPKLAELFEKLMEGIQENLEVRTRLTPLACQPREIHESSHGFHALAQSKLHCLLRPTKPFFLQTNKTRSTTVCCRAISKAQDKPGMTAVTSENFFVVATSVFSSSHDERSIPVLRRANLARAFASSKVNPSFIAGKVDGEVEGVLFFILNRKNSLHVD